MNAIQTIGTNMEKRMNTTDRLCWTALVFAAITLGLLLVLIT